MKNLLLLHGAIGSSIQLEQLAGELNKEFKVHLLNFTGHGGKEIPDKPFSIEMFAEDIIYLIERGRMNEVNIFGYSMGGYAALYAARHFPGRINKIFTLATKFEWNEETSLRESKFLNPEKISEKIPSFAEQLRQRHSEENWKLVLNKTAEMMINMGKNNPFTQKDLIEIDNEVLVSVGDRDNMVTIEETVNAYRNLKNGKLLILPDTPHPIEKISADRLLFEILNYF